MPFSRRPERIMSARVRAPGLAAFALLALGFSGIFMPSRAGLPTLKQSESAQPGDAGASEAPRAGTAMFNQTDSAKPPDANPASAAKDHPLPPAHPPAQGQSRAPPTQNAASRGKSVRPAEPAGDGSPSGKFAAAPGCCFRLFRKVVSDPMKRFFRCRCIIVSARESTDPLLMLHASNYGQALGSPCDRT